MKRLISTINLSKEEWLRYRKCGITGTDAGAILGLNPYRSAFQVSTAKLCGRAGTWKSMWHSDSPKPLG